MSWTQVRRLLCVRLSPDNIKHVILPSNEEEEERVTTWTRHVALAAGKPHFSLKKINMLVSLTNSLISLFSLFLLTGIIDLIPLLVLLPVLMFGFYNSEYIMMLIMPHFDS